jgi:hypothetical protein
VKERRSAAALADFFVAATLTVFIGFNVTAVVAAASSVVLLLMAPLIKDDKAAALAAVEGRTVVVAACLLSPQFVLIVAAILSVAISVTASRLASSEGVASLPTRRCSDGRLSVQPSVASEGRSLVDISLPVPGTERLEA